MGGKTFVTQTTDSAMPGRVRATRDTPVFLALFALSIFVLNWGCVVLVSHVGRVTPIWLGNAIVLACLLRRRGKAWLPLLALATLANFAADIAYRDLIANAVGFSLANTAEVLAMAVPLRWFGLDRAFSRTDALLTFYALVLCACGLSSVIAASTLWLSEGVPFALVFRS